MHQLFHLRGCVRRYGPNLALEAANSRGTTLVPISSLVVTFDSDPDLRAHAREWLGAASGISTGELQGQRLPVVLETLTLSEGRLVIEEMQRVRGISFVNVLSINFEDGDF